MKKWMKEQEIGRMIIVHRHTRMTPPTAVLSIDTELRRQKTRKRVSVPQRSDICQSIVT